LERVPWLHSLPGLADPKADPHICRQLIREFAAPPTPSGSGRSEIPETKHQREGYDHSGPMKTLALILAVAAGVFAVQDDRAPINQTCPVMKGKLIRKDLLSVYKGQPLGFCCEKCKDEWDKDPSEYAANLTTAPAPKVVPLAVPGKPAPEFELRDSKGYIARSADFQKKIVILQWMDRECKTADRVAKTVMPDLLAKVKKLSDKFVHLYVCSVPNAMVESVDNFISDYSLESRGLMDRDGSTAKVFGAMTTCHVFIIDGDGVLRYSGAIDDDPAGKKGDKRVNHVLAAVTAIVEGKKVTPAHSKPYGTPLRLPK
jgi:peroxiredoxin/YHS domain-containing protein